MNIKELKDYLNILDERFDKVKIFSTDNICGCEESTNCNSVVIEVKDVSLGCDRGRLDINRDIDNTAFLLLS
jgi:hypothetical protein